MHGGGEAPEVLPFSKALYAPAADRLPAAGANGRRSEICVKEGRPNPERALKKRSLQARVAGQAQQ